MKEYEIINTGKAVTLATLLISDDIKDSTIIQIFDADGRFLTKGTRYQSWIAEWYDQDGTAETMEGGYLVSFKLSKNPETPYT